MRTYAQDTALPGGKYEEGDEDEEGTAVGAVSISPLPGSMSECTDNHRGGKHMRR